MIKFELPITTLWMSFLATNPIVMPKFAGSKLEGAFGHALYDISCTRKDLKTCHPCPLRKICPYAALYSPILPEHMEVSSLETPPRPLVFIVELQKEHQVQPGEKFEFGVRVIGKAIQHLAYIVAAMRQMGQNGIGLTRGRYELLEVKSLNPYDQSSKTHSQGQNPTVNLEPIEINTTQLPPIPGQAITINFQTFTHLKNAGRVVEIPYFQIFVRAIQRRLSNLEQIYGAGKSTSANYSQLPQLARQIHITRQDTKFVSQVRSGKGKRPVVMNGFVGSVHFEGKLEPFGQLLRYGELIGVGKWAHFGAGRYTIEEEKTNIGDAQ